MTATSDLATFAAALPSGGRLAGLDVGDKTVGIAYCDARWTIATGAETLKRSKFSVDANALQQRFAAQQVAGVVVGLPLNMDGSYSPQTQSVRGFGQNLASRLALPMLLWDERWSTQAVTRALIDADASRASRSRVVDKLAAAYILQGAIDALARRTEETGA